VKVPKLTDDDLAYLVSLAPDLDPLDAERRAFLLENNTRDVNAAPGSGKTTALAAKLLLLARNWPHERRGICVLSHTNVAREEIQKRLVATPQGSRLLSYPHFIGTIHSFVNQFLALPYLRSNDIAVDVIDDEIFSSRAIGLAKKSPPLRFWAQNNQSVFPIVAGLVYRGADLTLASEGGYLPKPGSTTLPLLQQIKLTLAQNGVFRFADMFAFADALLAQSPSLKERLSERFPLVFIDEMQDTSWPQEELLSRLFADDVVVQRLGDLNQRILGSDEGASKLTFPRTPELAISTSKRFGPAIASAVSRVRTGGAEVIGERTDMHPLVLLTYPAARVGDVLNHFGQKVLESFTDAELAQGPVKALCARKQGDAKKEEPGRTLIDFWPAYAGGPSSSGARSERFWSLLGCATYSSQRAATLADRAADAKRAVFLVLRSAGSPHLDGVRDGSQLFRHLHERGHDTKPARRLCRAISLDAALGTSAGGRAKVPDMFYDALRPLLANELVLDNFRKLDVFNEPDDLPEVERQQRICTVEHGDRRVDIQIGSIASMKGETHLATLVLESYGWPSRRFDLNLALPIIADTAPLSPGMPQSQLAQFRNLYVGMSRPTSLLCLAVNENRVSEECKAALSGQGWRIEQIH